MYEVDSSQMIIIPILQRKLDSCLSKVPYVICSMFLELHVT